MRARELIAHWTLPALSLLLPGTAALAAETEEPPSTEEPTPTDEEEAGRRAQIRRASSAPANRSRAVGKE